MSLEYQLRQEEIIPDVFESSPHQLLSIHYRTVGTLTPAQRIDPSDVCFSISQLIHRSPKCLKYLGKQIQILYTLSS